MKPTSHTTPTKRQEQAQARRRQLLETALPLFTEMGYRGATIRDIARAAGVNEALLYHYFKSKADLFRAVLDEYAPIRALSAFSQAARDLEPAKHSLHEALNLFGQTFTARIRAYHTFIVTVLTEAPGDPELAAILRAFLQSTNDDITRFLTDYRNVGQVNPGIPIETAARILMGSLLFQFLTEAIQPHPRDGAPGADDQAVHEIIAVLLAGLTPR